MFETLASRKLMRLTARIQIAIVFIFSLNAWLQTHERHGEGPRTLRESTIAEYFILIPLSAIYAFVILRHLRSIDHGPT